MKKKTERKQALKEQQRHEAKKLARQRDFMKHCGASTFRCNPCDREVVIRWAELGAETPCCRECGGKLQIVEAARNKGVLPPAYVRPESR